MASKVLKFQFFLLEKPGFSNKKHSIAEIRIYFVNSNSCRREQV
jgi:hypothetical protein